MDTGSRNALLKSVSRSFYLSVRFLPPAMRETVSLGYLLARFTDTIADAGVLPDEDRIALLDDFRRGILGEETGFFPDFPFFTDRITHAGERRLLQSSSVLFTWYETLHEEQREILSEVILTIIQGQSWDIRAFQNGNLAACETGEDLLRYAYQVAGSVGAFWTKIGFSTLGEKFADPDNAPAMLMCGRRLGEALQLINILRDLYEDLPAGRCYLPADELLLVGWSRGSVLTASEISPVFNRWLGIAHGFLDEADFYVNAVRDFRVRLSTRLPKLLAEETVVHLRNAGIERVLREKIKISRVDVWTAMGRAVFF